MDRAIEKKKWTAKRILTFAGGSLLLLFIIYNFIFGDSSSKLNVQTERLTISTVTRGPFQEYIPVTGTVLPILTVYLDAVEGGRVEKKFVEAGTFVKKGDKILKLANTNLLLDIMYREAQFYEQRNNLRTTRLQMEQNRLSLKRELLELDFHLDQLAPKYKRSQDLIEKNLISQEEFEKVKSEYEYYLRRKALAMETHKQDSLFRQVQIQQLESSVKRLETNLEIVKRRLASLVIRAPVSGQLTSLMAEIGESKSPGQRLGQIDVLEGFKVRAAIDEHYLARVQTGQPGEFEFAGKTYHLITKKIYPEIRGGRFDVDLEFQGEQPAGIRRGQTLHIRLQLGEPAEALLLPRGGFYQTTGGQWVYVLDPSGRFATKRHISLGRQNPNMYEVLQGLREGERVITSSYENFGDNDVLVLK